MRILDRVYIKNTVMNNTVRQESAANEVFTIELFGANGSRTISGDKSILFTKIVCSEGVTNWVLLHQN